MPATTAVATAWVTQGQPEGTRPHYAINERVLLKEQFLIEIGPDLHDQPPVGRQRHPPRLQDSCDLLAVYVPSDRVSGHRLRSDGEIGDVRLNERIHAG